MRSLLLCLIISILACTSCIKIIDLSQNNTDNNEEVEDIKPQDEAKLLSFNINKELNPVINENIEFTIYSNNNITAYTKADFDTKHLIASFEIENGYATINSRYQESGISKNDYTNKFEFVVNGHNNKKKTYIVHLLPYTGLPVATITTCNEKEIVNKEDWLPANMHIDGMGIFEDFNDSLYVRGRGNGSWKFPKKPFNAKLYNKKGVLGMNNHKRWCFLANYRDRTLLRNDLVFKLGQMTDGLEWTPNGEFVEVIFNGKHQGNFYICEHIRVDSKRVNINEIKANTTNITGGYLLELDRYFDEVNKFKTVINEWPVNIKSPDEDVFTTEHLEYIENYYNTIEFLLQEGNFELLYNEYLDINSFADYYLIQTLSGNTELQSIYSVYCYKKRDGKLYAGPLWDFDLSTFSRESGTTHNTSVWYKYLLKDSAFKKVLKERYSKLKPKIHDWGIDYLNKQYAYLHKSEAENWKYWEIDTNFLYNRLNGDETFDTYEEGINRLIYMFQERINWLESYLD